MRIGVRRGRHSRVPIAIGRRHGHSSAPQIVSHSADMPETGLAPPELFVLSLSRSGRTQVNETSTGATSPIIHYPEVGRRTDRSRHLAASTVCFRPQCLCITSLWEIRDNLSVALAVQPTDSNLGCRNLTKTNTFVCSLICIICPCAPPHCPFTSKYAKPPHSVHQQYAPAQPQCSYDFVLVRMIAALLVLLGSCLILSANPDGRLPSPTLPRR